MVAIVRVACLERNCGACAAAAAAAALISGTGAIGAAPVGRHGRVAVGRGARRVFGRLAPKVPSLFLEVTILRFEERRVGKGLGVLTSDEVV